VVGRAAGPGGEEGDGPEEEKPVDAEAQADRRERRLARMRDGMADLHRWVTDWVRAGIASAPAKGWEYFEAQARRLVDAQAPGAARRVQDLGSVAARGAGWQRPFLERLALLHLLWRATERIDRLPDDDRADLLAALGVPVPQEELASRPAVRDVWRVACRTVEIEDKLRVQRTWLFGTKTNRPALVLHFAHGTAPLDTSLQPGTAFDGDVAFYPGTGPRAVVRTSPVVAQPAATPFGYDAFAGGLDAFCRAVAANPWLDRVFFPVQAVVPLYDAGRWSLADRVGAVLPLIVADRAGWTLLAVSGCEPVSLVAEFDGKALTPLAIVTGGATLPLAEPDREAA